MLVCQTYSISIIRKARQSEVVHQHLQSPPPPLGGRTGSRGDLPHQHQTEAEVVHQHLQAVVLVTEELLHPSVDNTTVHVMYLLHIYHSTRYIRVCMYVCISHIIRHRFCHSTWHISAAYLLHHTSHICHITCHISVTSHSTYLRVEFPIQLVGRLPHQLHCLPHQFSGPAPQILDWGGGSLSKKGALGGRGPFK